MQYHVYKTGDQVWMSQRFGRRVAVKIITHDGMIWEEGDTEIFRRFQGFEKAVHQATVFCIRVILSILS